MRRTLCAVLGLCLAGCQAARTAVRPPLQDEGELYVYAAPVAPGADAVALELEAAAASLGEGEAVPLELVPASPAAAAGPGVGRQRLLAMARLAPGRYAGLSVQVRRAAAPPSGGAVPLPAAAGPARLERPFAVAAGRATVLWLGVDLARAAAGAPDLGLALEAPPAPVPGRVAWITSPAAGTITAVERHLWRALAVLEPEGEPAGVAFDQGALRAYVTRAGADEVAVVDLAAGERLPPIRLRPGDRPGDVALTPDRRTLLVVNGGSASVSFLDPAGQIELARVQTGADPRWLLLDRAGRRAYACNETAGSITVIDVAQRSVVTTFATEARPVSAQLDRAGGKLYVVHAGSPFLGVYAVPGYAQVSRTPVGLGVVSVQVDPRTDLVFLGRRAGRQIEVLEPASLLSVGTIDLPGPVGPMVVDDAENALLAVVGGGDGAGALAVVELAGRRLVALVDAAGAPWRVAVHGERR